MDIITIKNLRTAFSSKQLKYGATFISAAILNPLEAHFPWESVELNALHSFA